MPGSFRHQEVIVMGTLGRLGIPAKVRTELGIEEGDTLNILVEDETITIRKHVGFCILCHSEMDPSYPYSVCRRCYDAAIGLRKLNEDE